MSSQFTLQEATENTAQRAQLIEKLQAPHGWLLREDLSQYTLFIPRTERAALETGAFAEIVQNTLGGYSTHVHITPVMNRNGIMGDEVGISGTAYDKLAQTHRTQQTAATEDTQLRALLQQRLFSEKAMWKNIGFMCVAHDLGDFDYGPRSAEDVKHLIIEAFEGKFEQGQVPPGLKVLVDRTPKAGHFEIDVSLPIASRTFSLTPKDEPNKIVTLAELRERQNTIRER